MTFLTVWFEISSVTIFPLTLQVPLAESGPLRALHGPRTGGAGLVYRRLDDRHLPLSTTVTTYGQV